MMPMVEYITAKDIVDKLGIKNPSIRRKVYRYIKNIMYELEPDKYEELLYKNDSKMRRYVMKIPVKYEETLINRLQKYRTVKKIETFMGPDGKIQKRTVIIEQW